MFGEGGDDVKKLEAKIFCRILLITLFWVTSVSHAYAHDYLLKVDASAHRKFGLFYPATYRFKIPDNVGALSVQYRYSDGDSWGVLPARNGADTFNGVDAVRFDYANTFAYISIRFSRSSDAIYLRMVDQAGQPVDFTFDSIPTYYDDRKAAVTITLDDYADWSYSAFDPALQFLDSHSLQPTIGIIAGQVNNWGLLQGLIDKYGEKAEVASHGATHLCNAADYLYYGYEAEVVGSRDLIRARLSFPAYPYITMYIEPCGYSDTTLQSWISTGDYLASRSVRRGGGFTAWDPLLGRYGRAAISFDDYRYTDNENLLLDANAAFEQALAGGNIYHLLNHPATGLWHDNSYLLQHLNHIKGRKDVWYVPVGYLYQYHFLQERRGGLTITSHESTPGQPPANRTPVADAGSNQVVTGGTTVTLDGSRSYDPDNDPLAYSWTQLQGPVVTLSAAKTANPAFTAPETEMPLLFQLVVSDGKISSAAATVRIETLPATRTISTSVIGNGSIVCTPGTTVTNRTPVSCSVTANPYHHLSDVTIDGASQALKDTKTFSYSFGAVTANHYIVARFSLDSYSLSFVPGEGGTVAGSTSQNVSHGLSTSAVTALPDTGYHFLNWTAPDGFTSTANPLTISNVTGNRTITANFEADMFTVEFVSGGNGTISGSASQRVRYDMSAAAVTAVPTEGFHFVNWTAPGGFTSSANPLTLGNITESRTITANFAADTFDVLFVSGGNGTITGAASQRVAYGASATAVTAVSAEGFHFVKWSSPEGFSSRANPLILASITGSLTLTAQFSRDVHTVTPVSGMNGTIQPALLQVVEHGSAVSFTLTPAAGYRIATASGCGGTLKGAVYTTGSINADCSVSVAFAKDEFTVSGTVTGVGGMISCGTPVSSGGASNCTIEPEHGFALTALTDNGTDMLAAVKGNSYVIPYVVGNHSVAATFGGRSYTVSDAVRAQQLVLGKLQVSNAEIGIYDLAPLGADGRPHPDGVVDVGDVVIMLRRLVGILNW